MVGCNDQFLEEPLRRLEARNEVFEVQAAFSFHREALQVSIAFGLRVGQFKLITELASVFKAANKEEKLVRLLQ